MSAILIRWAFAFVLLAATYNPTPYNFVVWARQNLDTQLPVVLLLGLLLMIGYIVYLRATLRSIGAIGMVLVAAVVGALVWVLYDWGWLTLENSALNLWIGIFALSAVLGIGLSWSIMRRRISGQADVHDIDA